jgi:hypothetical protein
VYTLDRDLVLKHKAADKGGSLSPKTGEHRGCFMEICYKLYSIEVPFVIKSLRQTVFFGCESDFCLLFLADPLVAIIESSGCWLLSHSNEPGVLRQ